MGVNWYKCLRVLPIIALSFFTVILSGCGSAAPRLSYLALLAPFEGRYREVGYDLLYATRLGLSDAQLPNIELLPLDDGGSVKDAVDRARALALNPDVRAVLVGGVTATSPDVLAAFNTLPVVTIGGWSAEAADGDGETFILASEPRSDQMDSDAQNITDIEIAATTDTPIRGGEIFGLKQFSALRDDLDNITVITSAAPPDAAFRARFLNSGMFVPEPGLLTTLAYDAAKLTAQAIGDDHPTRRVVRDRLAATDYDGLNGVIRFENGYWADAPIFQYTYTVEGVLQPVNGE